MSVRVAAAIATLMLLGAAAGPADLAGADDKAATAKKTSAAKAPEKAEKDDFGTAKREIQARLRSKQPLERIAALRQLHDYPIVDAARLLVTVGLRDDEPSVRDAAYYTLLDLNDHADIARYLLLTVNKDSRHGEVNQTTLQLLAVLLASTSPDIERDVSAYLEKRTRMHDGLILVESLADGLGDHGRAEDVGPLTKLAGLKIFSAEFGLRRAVAEALMKISAPEAIGQLVTLLEKLRGELRAEIVKHLCEATGQDFGLEAAVWRLWWKENEKTFQMVGAPAGRRDGNNLALGGPSRGASMYYGLSIYAEKMVFIIDTSSSMLQGGRLMAAKRELLQAIDGLSDDAQFSVLAFNGEVYAWHKQLMPANTAMKQAASLWISALETGNTTASYDALETGMRFDAEAMFFLTDGVPQGGKINNPADIVALITRANWAKRMSIYTIGIGVLGPQGGIFDTFLTALAKQNWGIYRRVDK
jgi:von Willebrand factor type A domain